MESVYELKIKSKKALENHNITYSTIYDSIEASVLELPIKSVSYIEVNPNNDNVRTYILKDVINPKYSEISDYICNVILKDYVENINEINILLKLSKELIDENGNKIIGSISNIDIDNDCINLMYYSVLNGNNFLKSNILKVKKAFVKM